MNKAEIQKQLQLTDLETSQRFKKSLERSKSSESLSKKTIGQTERKVIQRYIKDLASTIYFEKINDFPAAALKIVSAEKIADYFGIEEINKKNALLFYRDLIRWKEKRSKDYEYQSNRKFKTLKKKEYEMALEYFADIIMEAAMEAEKTIQQYRFQAPQIFALITYPIDHVTLAYLSLALFLEIEADEIILEQDEDMQSEESEPNAMATVVRKLGEAVESQLWIEREKQSKMNAYQYNELLVHLIKNSLSNNNLLSVGIRLLGYLEESGISCRYKRDNDGSIVEYTDKYNRNEALHESYRTTVLVGYSDAFKEDIKKIKSRLIEQASMHYNPMVIEPVPWSGIATGGFLNSSFKYRLPFRKVRTSKEREYLHAITDKIPQEIYDAINTIQSTPFLINEKVYNYLKKKKSLLDKEIRALKKVRNEALHELRDTNKTAKVAYQSIKKVKNLPPESIIPIKENFLRTREAYRHAKRPYNKKIAPMAEHLQSIQRKLQVVERLHRLGITFGDPVWFVWQMDFRGRIYPVQAHLNPQGDDVAKGLLKFAVKKPLGEKGLFWLRVHGANLYGKTGLDKKPFEEREAWVKANETQISQTAQAPFESKLLEEAEDPVMFYAFCCEYAEYLKDPKHFETSLPVGVDGSNNGLQHISTLYRDKTSAISVNVLPSKKPQDIYQKVADHTRDIILEDHKEFEKEKENMLQNEEGLYLVKKEKGEVLYKNLMTESFIEGVTIHLSTLQEIYGQGNKKILQQTIKKYFKPWISTVGSKHQQRELKDLLYTLCIENRFDSKNIEQRLKEMCQEWENEKKYFYQNEKNLAVETVISPHNFIDDTFLTLIDRSMVKPNVMTDSYGTGIRTKQNQIITKLRTLHSDGKISLHPKYLHIVGNYIGKLNDRSIDEISEASARYMTWCKESVSTLYKKKKNHHTPIQWTTPLGLLVTQVKFKQKKGKKIETVYGQDSVRIQNFIETNEIDTRQQNSGLAPNFIHSLDATHMFMAVNAAHKDGVKSFMTIHDSFSTHASDVDKLLDALKTEFIQLHKKPIMENLKKELEHHYGVSLKKIKYVDADFKLNQLINSKYFFA